MSGKLSRWMRSKAGMQTMFGILAVLVVVAIAGQLLGWWVDLVDLITGTVAPPPPSYPPPTDGYTCLPTCSETDGKFLSMPGEQMASFGGESIALWVSVPGDYETFELGIFDGDSGKDNDGSLNVSKGNWDNTSTQSTYRLYTDPMKDGSTEGEIELGAWLGNDSNPTSGPYCTVSSDTMPNNGWYTITCNNVDQARGPSGHYFYRFEATRPIAGHGINAFKLRSDGYLSTGQSDLVDASFAIVGMLATVNDIEILHPNFQGDLSNLGESTYNGTWDFYFYLPSTYPTKTVRLEIWDGDFDRGTERNPNRGDTDTDDPNTTGRPAWALPSAVAEGAGGRGNPADNFYHPLYRRDPPVQYTITDPSGNPIYTNTEPSGTEEWERYVIDTDPNSMDASLPPDERADEITDKLEPGWYGWRIEGLDVHNTVWIRFNYETVPQPPPPPCDATCPRTIGYWKNNVKKVLIDGRTKGVQESQASIETALFLVAQYSPIFRHGIDVNNPQPIGTVERLTNEEAHMILQRDKNDYPGGRDAANSMLARALQQTLASWLNLMSGKICMDTVVVLEAHGGTFDGTIWEALQEAQDIVLNSGDLEHAKDIGDLINNGLLGEEAETSTCDDYTETMPPADQPPKDKDKPKAPAPEPPPPPVITCTEGELCTECTGNPCDSIFSPGYWKNYDNHYTDEEFLALIQQTVHYSGLSIAEALDILDNNADQYHRHLLSAELNVALNPGLSMGIYNSGSVSGFVLQVLEMAYSTDPANADADLTDAVLYLGAEGEGQGSCRVSCTP